MLALVQWALASPQDWTAIDLSMSGPQAWLNLPDKPIPSDDVIDDVPGWIFSVMVQGVDFYGFDHLALQPIAGNGIRVYAWVDDIDDSSFTYRWGEVWEFYTGRVDRRLKVKEGTIRHQGPDQRKTIFAEDLVDMTKRAPGECGGLPVQVLPWARFPTPNKLITRHGVWVKDEALWQRHFDVRRKPTWREWVR